MIVSSFGANLTAQQMIDLTRAGAAPAMVVQPASGFRVIQERSPGYAAPAGFLDQPCAKWAIGAGVIAIAGGAYWYSKRR